MSPDQNHDLERALIPPSSVDTRMKGVWSGLTKLYLVLGLILLNSYLSSRGFNTSAIFTFWRSELMNDRFQPVNLKKEEEESFAGMIFRQRFFGAPGKEKGQEGEEGLKWLASEEERSMGTVIWLRVSTSPLLPSLDLRDNRD